MEYICSFKVSTTLCEKNDKGSIIIYKDGEQITLGGPGEVEFNSKEMLSDEEILKRIEGTKGVTGVACRKMTSFEKDINSYAKKNAIDDKSSEVYPDPCKYILKLRTGEEVAITQVAVNQIIKQLNDMHGTNYITVNEGGVVTIAFSKDHFQSILPE